MLVIANAVTVNITITVSSFAVVVVVVVVVSFCCFSSSNMLSSIYNFLDSTEHLDQNLKSKRPGCSARTAFSSGFRILHSGIDGATESCKVPRDVTILHRSSVLVVFAFVQEQEAKHIQSTWRAVKSEA